MGKFNLGIGIDSVSGGIPAPPSLVTTQFIVDTILGKVDFIDNSGGTAQHEIYSSTNGAGDVLLTTLNAGIVTYNDTACKQNASVVYKIRAKRGSIYSDYVSASALVTPLCFKTNQTSLNNVTIYNLNIAAGKTVNINWGDNTNENYTGNNANIVKTYTTTGNYNISITGDTNSITNFSHYSKLTTTGVITNWILPSGLITLIISGTGLTGSILGWVLPSVMAVFNISSTALTGNFTNYALPVVMTTFNFSTTGINGTCPQIVSGSGGLSYGVNACAISDIGCTVFRRGMTSINISNQTVPVSSAKIDKFLLDLANFYQANAPTANCTFSMSGPNIGSPTGGASNTDLLRLANYYVAAGKTATIVISS